ncbi:MAG: hypothetical protein M5U13_03950 [Thermoanaerobaculia bacterium]|nr:hypothetical protein [Thermoanaerobaculia bacterium]
MAGNRTGVRFAAAVAVLLAAGGSGAAQAAGGDREAGSRVLRAAAMLRALALDDFSPALERFATPEARAAVRGWEGELWLTVPPRAGWSFFFGTSVWTATGLDSAAPRVGFYHPWSDVWLLTEWSVGGEEPRLTGAEILMGDWLREEATFEPVPAWQRGGAFAPAALALATAAALRAFELESEAAGAGVPMGPREPEAAAGLRSGAALLLAASLRGVRELAVPRPGEPVRLTALRAAATATLAEVRAGGLARLAMLAEAAPETLPATRRAIAELPAPPAVARRLVPVHSVAAGAARSFVLAGDPADGDLLLSLLYDELGAAPRLVRVDLVTYSGAYRALFPPPAQGGSGER